MPVYDICYVNVDGVLSYKYSRTCQSDVEAKIFAHAMKDPNLRRLEVWSGETLIYQRPAPIHSAPFKKARTIVGTMFNV